ncbi:MAG: serine/threonine-protein kinase, partial [Planctomycetota bacterium]
MTGPADPASLRASLPESPDATAQVLERLLAHGAHGKRYQTRGEVARGGMGVILKVWDEDLRRELAMKVVLGEEGVASVGTVAPKMLGRFLEEAQVTGQLDHPGIVPVHELGLDERGSVFFTMRLVKGRDLKEIFERVHAGDEEWTQTHVLWALLKVCDALAYAHAKGVVHRDLKPANVMIGRFGEVYVMDWGLARVLGRPDKHDLRLKRDETAQSLVQSDRRADVSHSADSLLFTMDGDVVGTPAYMAPEQARGEIEKLGPRSDVYALGAMLYHLLAGEMPYVPAGAKLSQHAVLKMTLEGPPKGLHELARGAPEELIAISEKAMARDPEQRYADMGALGADLRAYLENRVVQAHRRGAWVEFVKWMRRNRALATAWSAAIVVALLGLCATLFVQVRERRAAEDARRRAETSELAAVASREEAERQEASARRERSNVLRLSAFQELGELEREAARLWPATPERIPEMELWLTRARRLIAGLEPGVNDDPGHRGQLAELAARARPLAPEERARRIAAHPRGAELTAVEAELAALELAAEVRAGRARPPEVEPKPELMSDTPLEWNMRAFAFVDPARRSFGREAEGLALARYAADEFPEDRRYLVLDTLAWALFACGLDEEALATSREALAEVPPKGVVRIEELLERLAQAVELARGPRGGEALAAAR